MRGKKIKESMKRTKRRREGRREERKGRGKDGLPKKEANE